MASITPYKNKDGVIVSYRFRACVGRDELGKQQFATKTVKLTDKEAKLTPKKLECNGKRTTGRKIFLPGVSPSSVTLSAISWRKYGGKTMC